MTTDAVIGGATESQEVPERRDDLMVAEVGDEAVIFDPVSQQMHRLDPAATLVWKLLDGKASIDETCREISDGFGSDIDKVRSDVLSLIDNLKGRHLLVGSELAAPVAAELANATPPSDEGFWVPMEMNGCVATVTSQGWSDLTGVAVDGHGVGIRTDGPEETELVRQLFAEHLVQESDETLPNISIRGPRTQPDQPSELGRLYCRCTLVERSRDFPDLLTRLVREVEAQVAPYRADGLQFHGAVLEITGAGAVLAPEPAWSRLLPNERSLRHEGLHLVARDAVLDPRTLEVVIPGTGLALNTAVLGGAAEGLQAEIRLPLRGWLMETGDPAGLNVPRGQAALMAQSSIVNAASFDATVLLSAIAELVNHTPMVTYLGEWRTILETARGCATRV